MQLEKIKNPVLQSLLGTPAPPVHRTGLGRMTIRRKRKRKYDSVCSVPGCDREHSSRGWCNTHYKRWYRYGNPLAVKKRDFKIVLQEKVEERD